MHPKLVMFFVFSYVTATLMCLFIEGAWLGDEEVTVMNALTGMSMLEVSGSGLWTVPKLIGGFFTVGVPRLIFASRTSIVPFGVAIPFILLALGILVKERTVSL